MTMSITIFKELPDVLCLERRRMDSFRRLSGLLEQLYNKINETYDIESGLLVANEDAISTICANLAQLIMALRGKQVANESALAPSDERTSIEMLVEEQGMTFPKLPGYLQERVDLFLEVIDVLETMELKDIETSIMNSFTSGDGAASTFYKREIYYLALDYLNIIGMPATAFLPIDEPDVQQYYSDWSDKAFSLYSNNIKFIDVSVSEPLTLAEIDGMVDDYIESFTY